MLRYLSPHFSLEELTASQTAARLGIDNIPPPHIVTNLKRLAETLEQVRALLKRAVLVTSGYRCPELNKAIGGSRTSAHMQGLAADFISPGYGTPYEICAALTLSNIHWDQVIHEFGRWVHIGLADEPQRQQVLTAAHTPHGTHYTVGLHAV